MIFSKRSNAASVLIDHRNSPGVSVEFIRANHLEGKTPIVGAGAVFESAMKICHGCGGDIILNPDRSNDPVYCQQHDGYLCDNCALRRQIKGYCKPWAQIFAEAYDKLQKASR